MSLLKNFLQFNPLGTSFNSWGGPNNFGMMPFTSPAIEQNMFCSNSSLFTTGMSGAANYGVSTTGSLWQMWDQELDKGFDLCLKRYSTQKEQQNNNTEATATATESSTPAEGTEANTPAAETGSTPETPANGSQEAALNTATEEQPQVEAQPAATTTAPAKTKTKKKSANTKTTTPAKATTPAKTKTTTPAKAAAPAKQKSSDGYTEVKYNPNKNICPNLLDGTVPCATLGTPNSKAKNNFGGYDYYNAQGVWISRSYSNGTVLNIKTNFNVKPRQKVTKHPANATVLKNGYYYVKTGNKVRYYNPYGEERPEEFKKYCPETYLNTTSTRINGKNGTFYLKSADGTCRYYNRNGKKFNSKNEYIDAQKELIYHNSKYGRINIVLNSYTGIAHCTDSNGKTLTRTDLYHNYPDLNKYLKYYKIK